MATTERRISSSRRGMTVLGKVPAVPKPINLPSQRLENRGAENDVEIVPRGTFSWGSIGRTPAGGKTGNTDTAPVPSVTAGTLNSAAKVQGDPTSDNDTEASSETASKTSSSGNGTRPSSAPGTSSRVSEAPSKLENQAHPNGSTSSIVDSAAPELQKDPQSQPQPSTAPVNCPMSADGDFMEKNQPPVGVYTGANGFIGTGHVTEGFGHPGDCYTFYPPLIRQRIRLTGSHAVAMAPGVFSGPAQYEGIYCSPRFGSFKEREMVIVAMVSNPGFYGGYLHAGPPEHYGGPGYYGSYPLQQGTPEHFGMSGPSHTGMNAGFFPEGTEFFCYEGEGHCEGKQEYKRHGNGWSTGSSRDGRCFGMCRDENGRVLSTVSVPGEFSESSKHGLSKHVGRHHSGVRNGGSVGPVDEQRESSRRSPKVDGLSVMLAPEKKITLLTKGSKRDLASQQQSTNSLSVISEGPLEEREGTSDADLLNMPAAAEKAGLEKENSKDSISSAAAEKASHEKESSKEAISFSDDCDSVKVNVCKLELLEGREAETHEADQANNIDTTVSSSVASDNRKHEVRQEVSVSKCNEESSRQSCAPGVSASEMSKLTGCESLLTLSSCSEDVSMPKLLSSTEGETNGQVEGKLTVVDSAANRKGRSKSGRKGWRHKNPSLNDVICSDLTNAVESIKDNTIRKDDHAGKPKVTTTCKGEKGSKPGSPFVKPKLDANGAPFVKPKLDANGVQSVKDSPAGDSTLKNDHEGRHHIFSPLNGPTCSSHTDDVECNQNNTTSKDDHTAKPKVNLMNKGEKGSKPGSPFEKSRLEANGAQCIKHRPAGDLTLKNNVNTKARAIGEKAWRPKSPIEKPRLDSMVSGSQKGKPETNSCYLPACDKKDATEKENRPCLPAAQTHSASITEVNQVTGSNLEGKVSSKTSTAKADTCWPKSSVLEGKQDPKVCGPWSSKTGQVLMSGRKAVAEKKWRARSPFKKYSSAMEIHDATDKVLAGIQSKASSEISMSKPDSSQPRTSTQKARKDIKFCRPQDWKVIHMPANDRKAVTTKEWRPRSPAEKKRRPDSPSIEAYQASDEVSSCVESKASSEISTANSPQPSHPAENARQVSKVYMPRDWKVRHIPANDGKWFIPANDGKWFTEKEWRPRSSAEKKRRPDSPSIEGYQAADEVKPGLESKASSEILTVNSPQLRTLAQKARQDTKSYRPRDWKACYVPANDRKAVTEKEWRPRSPAEKKRRPDSPSIVSSGLSKGISEISTKKMDAPIEGHKNEVKVRIIDVPNREAKWKANFPRRPFRYGRVPGTWRMERRFVGGTVRAPVRAWAVPVATAFKAGFWAKVNVNMKISRNHPSWRPCLPSTMSNLNTQRS